MFRMSLESGLARDAKFALASTSDRPLLKNAMTIVVSQTWQNCHEDNTSVHATRSLSDWNLAVLLKMRATTFVQVESASGSVLRRNRRDIRETTEKHVFLSTDDDRQRNFRETAADDDSCFCRASAGTCWQYSVKRVRLQVEQN